MVPKYYYYLFTASTPSATSTMPSPHPAWYKRYPFGFNVDRLTAIIVKHAEEFAAATRAARDIAEGERQIEILRFEETNDVDAARNDDAAQDDDAARDDESVASDASFTDKLNSGHLDIFRPRLLAFDRTCRPCSPPRDDVAPGTGGGSSPPLIPYELVPPWSATMLKAASSAVFEVDSHSS